MHLIHFTSCCMLVSLIWVIQILHYPFFSFVSDLDFKKAMKFHTSRITLIVAPLMLVELFSGFFLLIFYKFNLMFMISFAFILLIWLGTFFVSVPLHSKLEIQKNDNIIQKLVSTNWPRTIFWTCRFVLLVYLYKGTLI